MSDGASASPGALSRGVSMGPNRFARYAWGVFGYSLLVVVWGYFLRISRSGDGCGTDWPLCLGAAIPAAPGFPTLVEYVHRLTSGIVLVLVVVMAVWAFRRFPRGHGVRLAAGLALLFTVTESLFGAMLVVFGLVAEDASLARVLIRPFHVSNTFLLIGALALTPWWASRGTPARIRWNHPDRLLLLAGVGAIALLGWTGSWTGLANAAFPADSLRGGIGQYLSPEHALIYLRIAHPVVAVPAILFLGWLGIRTWRTAGSSDLPLLGLALTVTAGVQILLGPLSVLAREGVAVPLLHLFAADLAWVALLLIGATLLGEDAAEGDATPRSGRAGSPVSAG